MGSKSNFVGMLCSGVVFAAAIATAANEYEIEAASNDETFVINGEVFKAKTYCLGWDDGDKVIFLDGSALGVCTSATLYNVTRKEKCEVWCE